MLPRAFRLCVAPLLPLSLLLLLLPSPAQAGDAPEYAPAESAAVARRAWGEARAARAAKRYPDAVAHAERAHAAWPGQWVYAYGLASMAALAGQGSTCARALRDLTILGAGPDLTADTTLVAFANSAAGRRAMADVMLRSVPVLTGALPRSTVALSFPAADSAFWPEGIAYDPATGRTFVAGVREGRVVVAARNGAVGTFLRGGVDVPWSALALAVDAPRGLLWVTTAALPQLAGYARADSGRAALLAFDLATGAPKERHDFPPAAEGHVPGDVVVAPDGDVYVSDSSHPVIWRLRDGAFEEWASDPGFRSLQGQAVSHDQRFLYVADYSHGLAAINRSNGQVTWLPVRAGSGTVLGLDGLVAWERGLVAVQNGLAPPRVLRIELDRDAVGTPTAVRTVHQIDRNPALADEPTLLVPVGDGLVYVANSQWEKYTEDGVRRPGTILDPPRLLRLEGADIRPAP